MRPEVGSETVGGKRQVMIQANREPAFPGPDLDTRELDLELPLHVFVEHNAAPMFFSESLRFGRFGILIWFRPRAPIPSGRIGFVQDFIQRAVHGVQVKQPSLPIDIAGEFTRAVGSPAVFVREKGSEKELEETELEKAYLLVFDELRLA